MNAVGRKLKGSGGGGEEEITHASTVRGAAVGSLGDDSLAAGIGRHIDCNVSSCLLYELDVREQDCSAGMVG